MALNALVDMFATTRKKYGTERVKALCDWPHSPSINTLLSLDFRVNRVPMKLFRISNTDITKDRRDVFGVNYPAVYS